jgi:copper oxidase (laccase) domain-containing protein
VLRTPLPQDRVMAAWSQVADGNMAHRYGDADEVNVSRAKFLAALGLTPADCVRLAVTEGTADRIRVVGRDLAGRSMDGGDPDFYCDAFITDEPGLALWLLVADCLPIIFFDPQTPRIALAHCGFVSTDLRLAAKVVAKLQQLGSNPADLQVVIGPGIQAKSYIFDNSHMKSTGPEWKSFLTHPDPTHTAIDLFAYNLAQLTGAGVPESQIHVSAVDVATDPDFFSHVRSWRTGEPEGRFAVLIALKGE